MSLIICFEYRFREPTQKSLQRYTFLIIYANFFTKKHPLFTKMQYNPIENASDPRKTHERMCLFVKQESVPVYQCTSVPALF